MTEPVVRKHFVFFGTVQHVGFRRRARAAAEAVGATGWVRNNRAGTVSMEIQGTEAQIGRVLRTLERAPRIQIDHIRVRAMPLEEEEGFYRWAEYKRRRAAQNPSSPDDAGESAEV